MENLGTTVKIILPIKDKAAWHLPQLKLNSKSQIFILDDQKTMHDFWRLKLNGLVGLDRIHAFSSTEEFRSYFQAKHYEPEDCIFLFDYDLRATQGNGLDELCVLHQKSIRVLVTGHFDMASVRNFCAINGFHLLPKVLAERLFVST